MKCSDSIAKISKALLAVQGEIEPVPLDGENSEVNTRKVHRYSSFTAMWLHIRPILQKHGLAMMQGGGTEDIVPGYLRLETTVIHESGEFITESFSIPFKQLDPQGGGSAITYARRYGLSAMFALISEHDDDANAAMPKKEETSKAAAKVWPKPAVDTPSKPAPKPTPTPKPVDDRPLEEVSTENLTKATQVVMDNVSRLLKEPQNAEEIRGKLRGVVEHASSLRARKKMTDLHLQQLQDMIEDHMTDNV